MLLSHLVGFVFKSYGPVTNYWAVEFNEHISAHYVITAEERCNVALGLTLEDLETSLTYGRTEIKDENGVGVKVYTNDPDPLTVGYMLPGVMWRSPESIVPGREMTSAFLLKPESPRFSVTIETKSQTESGEVFSETTKLWCDLSLCECRDDRPPKFRGNPIMKF